MSKPSVNAPAPRDLGGELLQTYYGQARTAQPYFNLESYFQPKYGQLQLGNLQQQLFGYNVPQGGPRTPTVAPGTIGRGGGTGTGGKTCSISRVSVLISIFQDPYTGANTPSQTPGYHPGTLALGAAANTFQRGADIRDIATLGPAAQQAFLAANPYLASSLNNLMGRTTDSPILQTLNQQAQNRPQFGRPAFPAGNKRPRINKLLAHTLRPAMAHGNPAIAAQLLNRDALTRQRMQAAQQLATGVQGFKPAASRFGRAGPRRFHRRLLSDPFQAILGRPSGAAGGMGGGGYPQTNRNGRSPL